jgi:hypothetical protein
LVSVECALWSREAAKQSFGNLLEQEVLAGFELVLSAVSVKNKFTKNRKKA